MKKIPFDSFVLQAVVAELQPFVGGRVQDLRQPSDYEVTLTLYAAGKEAMLLLSAHPEFYRMHLSMRRPRNATNPPQFVSAMRARLSGATFLSVEQLPGERLVILRFTSDSGSSELIVELMGKHSNLILVDEHRRILGALKWVGRGKSVRPIQPNTTYVLPPVLGGPPKGSQIYRALVDAGADLTRPRPVLAPGYGAYPISVASLGYVEHPRETISVALEQFYAQEIPRQELESLRSSLMGQLSRVQLAREAALSDLRQTEAEGGKAPQWQRQGELLLAYGVTLNEGASTLEAFDYDGQPATIKLDPELDYRQNATRYFDRAKRAKGRLSTVRDQIERLSLDLGQLNSVIAQVAAVERLDELADLQQTCREHRWLQEQRSSGKAKEDRPFEGHRVRETVGPGGFSVLYGETAEANDYLTLRVARPNDYWLHVRGGVSAHVVIQTRNQPERVQRELLQYAAELAVRHSPSKHAGYVSVDYTLKKYVRKPRGAPKGTALYTHEKTLSVSSETG